MSQFFNIDHQGVCPYRPMVYMCDSGSTSTCLQDSDCPITQKCCASGCGYTCQTPFGKEWDEGCYVRKYCACRLITEVSLRGNDTLSVYAVR